MSLRKQIKDELQGNKGYYIELGKEAGMRFWEWLMSAEQRAVRQHRRSERRKRRAARRARR